MTIPLTQFQTWSGQGSITQSRNTYATIKAALESPNASYQDRNFKVFLQGSYGNDTNIYAESDVDVVIRYDGAFFHDIKERPAVEQAAFNTAYPNSSTYRYNDFKEDVVRALRTRFANSVKPGKRAIRIEGNDNRRNTDVIVAFEYKRFYRFESHYNENHDTGICFFSSDGTLIPNYPEQHSQNLTLKHQATDGKFKPLVRIFKNLRSRLEADGVIARGSAPSYYIEGLLYNVPNERFVGNYEDVFLNILKWLYETKNRVDFVCANEEYYLLRDNYPTCWACADGDNFIDAAIQLWNSW
jgi:hypothetical protein